jgi:arylsulfatase A-like enzyme
METVKVGTPGLDGVDMSGRGLICSVRRLLAMALWVHLTALPAGAQQIERPPNVVLIVADYMGYSDIGPYGATDIRTPSLDRLAAEGVRFSNYYAAAPICGPSRAALLSGYYPPRAGLETNISGPDQGLPASRSTLVREMKNAGYATGVVGKWHLGAGSEFGPMAHGFDSFFGFHQWTLGYHSHLTSLGEPGLYRDDELVREEGYLTDLFTEDALEFIDSNSEDPFFLYLAYNTGLPPYQGPDLPESQWGRGWDVNEASRADLVAMVESMDDGIGMVLDRLDERGLADNTLVLFTYDHGGRHLVRSDPLFHGFATLWEGGIRVPLILRWPDELESDRTLDQTAIAMDVTATILDAAGRTSATGDLDGQSLLPGMPGHDGSPGIDPDRTLFWRIDSFAGPMKAVRKRNWKLVIDGNTQLLFDLEADIGERHNAYSEHPEVARELREALTEWERSLLR